MPKQINMENIRFKNNLDKEEGNITALEKDKEVGKLEFSLNATELTVDHTKVSPEKRGSDLGRRLVEKALELSEEKKLSIKSNCTYAKKVLDRME